MGKLKRVTMKCPDCKRWARKWFTMWEGISEYGIPPRFKFEGKVDIPEGCFNGKHVLICQNCRAEWEVLK